MAGQRKDAAIGAKTNPQLPEQLITELKGLYTYPNQFGNGPAGALAAVQNAALVEPGIIDCRRGKYVYASSFTAAVQGLTFDTINAKTVLHASNDKIYVDNGTGTFTALTGSYTVPDVTDVESRVRSLNVSNNLYLTTGSGVYKLQSSASTPIQAGAPAGLGGSGVTTGASGFMTNSVNVAYRIVWLYIDLNNNLVQGAPSDRIVVTNSSGTTANVSLTFLVPTTVDTTWTYRIYRSNQSASVATEPDDQMQLVYSGSPTSGQITARTITITDSQPDTLRGETLYTTVQGIQNSNYQPPFSHDLALFKGSMFYANCSLKQIFFMTLISGALLVNGDTISFYRGATLLFTITGGAAENTATGTFLVATGGSPTQNITLTAQSIVKVINLYASNTVFDANYSSGYSEAPGKMQITARTFNTTAFSVVCSRSGNVFSPILPTAGVTNQNTSSSNNNPHYLYFSKYLQPEAVPLANTLAVGSSAYPIVRTISLRDSLMVFKTDGVYRVTGTATSNFSIVPVDVQLRISAVNSAQALNNSVYVMTEQGMVSIQDNGAVQVLSLPIQRDLLSLTTANYPGFKGASWGLSYPSDQCYYFYTVSSTSDAQATIAYVYNYITGNWSVDTKGFTAGYINPIDGKFYGSQYQPSGTKVYVERKTLSDFDYADEEYPVTITASSGASVTLASVANVAVGMTLGQASSFAYITAVDTGTKVITVADPASWATGAATVYTPIDVEFTLNPIDAGDPTSIKHFSEISMVTLASTLSNIQVSFTNDRQATETLMPIVIQPSGGPYGVGAYGTGAFGGAASPGYLRTRMFVPGSVQKSNWITMKFQISQSFKRVRFSVLSVTFRKIGVRQR